MARRRGPRLVTPSPSALIAVLGCVGVGALVALAPSVTCYVLAAGIVAALLAADRRTLPVATAIVTVVIAVVNPLAATAALALGLTAMLMARRVNWRPVALVGLPLALYLLIGGANISTYRGTVTAETIRVILAHVLVMIAGVFVLAVGARSGPRLRARPVGGVVLLLAFLPGVVGLAWITASSGIALLHPARRFTANSMATLLLETLTAALALYAFGALAQRSRFNRRDIWVIGGTLFALVLSGFRGWFLVGLAVVAFIAYTMGSYRPNWRQLAALALAGILVFAGFQAIRRAANPAALKGSQVAEVYGAEGIPPGLRDLHLTFRESIALSQRLFDRRDLTGVPLGQSLLLADFNTLRPGHQLSGGDVIGDLFGRQAQGGLTPGAVGAAYTDLGWWSLSVFLALGLVLGGLWRVARRRPEGIVLFVLTLIYSLHFMHRGIPKPSYVLVPLLFLLATTVGTFGPRTGRRDGSAGRDRHIAPPAATTNPLAAPTSPTIPRRLTGWTDAL